MPELDNPDARALVGESLGLDLDELGGDRGQELESELGEDSEHASVQGEGDDSDEGVREPTQPRDIRKQPGQAPPRFYHNAEVQPDQQGNLVDANGQIVARAGKERKLYQNGFNAGRARLDYERRRSDELQQRLNKAIEIAEAVNRDLEQAKNRPDMVREAGLSTDEHMQAIQFAVQAKRDPVNALKQLLTLASTRGIDLTQVGLQPGAIDPKSFQDQLLTALRSELNPIREQQQREQQLRDADRQTRERLSATENQVKTFFDENPEARSYMHVFQAIYNEPRFQNMPLSEAWVRIQLNLANRRPLRQRSMPSGRPLQANGQSPDAPAPVKTSYDDIIGDVLKQANWGG